MRRWMKSVMILLTAFFVLAAERPAAVFGAENHKDYETEDLRQIADEIVRCEKERCGFRDEDALFQGDFVKSAGSSAADWFSIAMGQLGYEDDYEAYRKALVGYVEKLGDAEMRSLNPTDLHRISLAILSCGGDPTDVGDGHVDLIAEGTCGRDESNPLDKQGVNGAIWGLIALDSVGYETPGDALYTRDAIVPMILEQQLPDGGFGFGGDETDPDITAMALTALAPYCGSEETYSYTLKASGKEVTGTVGEAADAALACLSKIQTEQGDFVGMESASSESAAQVLIALSSLGIDAAQDERFIKGGRTLLDVLMSFQAPDGGFAHERDASGSVSASDPVAGEQALSGLTAYIRFREGRGRMYEYQAKEGERQISRDTGVNKVWIPVAVIVIAAAAAVVLFICRKKRRAPEELSDWEK